MENESLRCFEGNIVVNGCGRYQICCPFAVFIARSSIVYGVYYCFLLSLVTIACIHDIFLFQNNYLRVGLSMSDSSSISAGYGIVDECRWDENWKVIP